MARSSKEFLEKLYHNFGDFEVTKLIKKGKEVTGSKWVKYSEVRETPKAEFMNCRSVLAEELILDLEEPERLNEIKEMLDKEKYTYEVWATGSRGYHIRLIFEEYKNLPEDIKPKVKEFQIKKYGCDTSKKSNRNVIALEYANHFKTGNPKTLIQTVVEQDNKFNKEILDYVEQLKEEQQGLESFKESIGITVSEIQEPYLKLGLETKLPEGDRNNVYMKNMIALVYHSSLEPSKKEELMKRLAENQEQTLSSCEGWIQKAKEGYKYNRVEIIKWAKKYGIKNLYAQEVEPQKERTKTVELIEKNKDYEPIKMFINDFDKYCYNSKFSGVLHFHSLLGQKIKEVFIFKNGTDKIDQRINVFIVQPSGTGKGKGMNFLFSVGRAIGLNCSLLTDFSDSALIGSYEKGTKREGNIKLTGLFEEADVIGCEEAESIFEKQVYKEGTVRRFNTAFNTIGTATNNIFKPLRYGTINFYPSFSGSFASVMFQDFHIQIKSGFFQRQLVYIQEEAIEKRLLNLSEDIKRVSFTTSKSKRQEVSVSENNLLQVYNEVFEGLKKYAEKTEFEEEQGLNEYIKELLEELFIETSRVQNSEIMGILFSFLSRWTEQLYKLAFHSVIIRRSSTIQKQDIDYAFSIMVRCYDNLLFFLEKNAQQIFQDKNVDKLRYIYGMLKNEPRVNATEILNALKEKFGISHSTVYNILNEFLKKGCLKKIEVPTHRGKEVFYVKPL